MGAGTKTRCSFVSEFYLGFFFRMFHFGGSRFLVLGGMDLGFGRFRVRWAFLVFIWFLHIVVGAGKGLVLKGLGPHLHDPLLYGFPVLVFSVLYFGFSVSAFDVYIAVGQEKGT